MIVSPAPERIAFANTLRGFAALAVVVAHLLGVYWGNPKGIEGLTLAPALENSSSSIAWFMWVHPPLPLNWGPFGVALFFIISGFVIPFSLQRQSNSAFLIGRLLRILPTYMLGFSLTLLALFVSTRVFGTAWPFGFGQIAFHLLPGIHDFHSSSSIDAIIWTLDVEMKFYCVCAIVGGLFRKCSLKVLLVPPVLFLLTLLFQFSGSFLAQQNLTIYRLAHILAFNAQFIVFMFIGVVFNLLHAKKLRALSGAALIAGLFCAFAWLWWKSPISGPVTVVFNYAAATALFAFAYAFPRFFQGNAFFNSLSAISYPLYVVHGVIGYVGLRLLQVFGLGPFAALSIVLPAIFALAWLLHIWVEKPSQRLAKAGAQMQKQPI